MARGRWDERHDVDLNGTYDKVLFEGMSDVDRAILFAEQHREVHLQWRDWIRVNGAALGNTMHNQEVAVRRYNLILKLLHELKELKGA